MKAEQSKKVTKPKLIENVVTRTEPIAYQDKNAYYQSAEYRKQRQQWLRRAGGYCEMFPWIDLTKTKKFEIHHVDREAYRNCGIEVFHEHIVVLSTFAHRYVMHWLLSGGKRRVRNQKDFPNNLQKMAVFWCRLPRFVKLFISFLIVALKAMALVLLMSLK